MWFAKWFGGRDEREEYEEPTAAPPPPPVTAPSTATSPQRPTAPAKAKPKGGFDPYNSGSFERRNAWERINRR
jgi:hypothetical protein